MKRFGFMLLTASFLLAVASGASVGASVSEPTPREFTGDYYLSKDGDGRAKLKVVEEFIVEFPEYDKNKGMVRVIPSSYDGHSLDIQVESLTRGGNPEPIYSQKFENGYLVIETGDESYVKGMQVYMLTYTMRDMLKDFGSYQEFYGDTIGVNWDYQFDKVTGRVHLDDSVSGLFTKETLCYQGSLGEKTPCQSQVDGSAVVFSSNGALRPKSSLSMHLKFKPGSFKMYEMGIVDMMIQYGVPVLGVVLSAVGLVWGIVLRMTSGRNRKGRGTIVPEYLPPQAISPVMASDVKGKGASVAITAQLVDMAVRHKIDIIEEVSKGVIGDKKTYKFKVRSVDGLTKDDAEFMRATTGMVMGAVHFVKKQDTKTGNKLLDLFRKASERMQDEGYRQAMTGATGPIVLSLVSGVFTWAVPTFLAKSAVETPLITMGPIATVIAVVILSILLLGRKPLTEKGAQLKEYLEGLEMYIKIGEEERLQILQSPQGASREVIDIKDTSQVIRLYERLLPYAILFGLEKEWGKVLEIKYGDNSTSPEWYQGDAFNAVAFGSAMSGFSSSITKSFTHVNSKSYGSGFSGGGGGAGGGFGGGGGGGFR